MKKGARRKSAHAKNAASSELTALQLRNRISTRHALESLRKALAAIHGPVPLL